MSVARTALMLIRALPDLLRTTQHLSWPVRIRYLAACLRLYRHESRYAEERRTRPPAGGNPAMRASCCGSRPDAYPVNRLPDEIPELSELLQPAGIGWSGYIRFFDCKACGQEWMLDWLPATHGGAQQLKKFRSDMEHEGRRR